MLQICQDLKKMNKNYDWMYSIKFRINLIIKYSELVPKFWIYKYNIGGKALCRFQKVNASYMDLGFDKFKNNQIIVGCKNTRYIEFCTWYSLKQGTSWLAVINYSLNLEFSVAPNVSSLIWISG